MKHLAAGLTVGGIVASVVIGVAFLWSIINWLVGPVAATVIMATTVVIAVGAAALDYVTERRGT